MSSQYARFIPLIEKRIQADVVSVLKNIDPDLIPASASPLRMGEIKSFSSLASASQVQGVPIFEVDTAPEYQKNEALVAFQNLANAIIKRTGKSGSASS